MQWKQPKSYQVGEQRTRTKFLWWPKTIEGLTKWLEFATYVEELKCFHVITLDDRLGTYNKWEPIYWVDQKDQKDKKDQGASRPLSLDIIS